MQLGGADPTQRSVAAEFDCQFQQFSTYRGSTLGRGDVGRFIECLQHRRVARGSAQREMSRLQLGFLHGAGELAMHGPALRRAGAGVNAAGEQGMTEPDLVAF